MARTLEVHLSGGSRGAQKERPQGRIFQEADLDAYGDDLAEIGRGGEIFAAGAKVRQAEVSGAGEMQAGGDDGGVEIDDGAELDFDMEHDGGWRESLAVEDPSAAVGEGGGKDGHEAVALFVTEPLDVERLHGEIGPPGVGRSAIRVFIGRGGRKREWARRYGSHVTDVCSRVIHGDDLRGIDV
jgi:hypothetical protein